MRQLNIIEIKNYIQYILFSKQNRFITMAKIKGELLINQKVILCKVLSMYHVSDSVLGIENKMINRNQVLALMELIFR